MRSVIILLLSALFFALSQAYVCDMYGYSLLKGQALAPLDGGATTAATVGVKFYTRVPGNLTIFYYYKSIPNTGVHKMYLWNNAGVLLYTKIFEDTVAEGQEVELIRTALPLAACQNYTLAYTTTTGHYANVPQYYYNRPVSTYFVKLLSGVTGPYGDPPVKPTLESSNNYGVDFAFRPADASCKTDYQVIFN